ncbi:MAG: hypothetical protein ACOZAM_06385 [Pseudomonadota bacterium]
MTTEVTAAAQANCSGDDPEAVNFLVGQGVTREAAIELLREAGPPGSHESVPEWADRILGRDERRRILAEHHETGIPPLEPPAR